MKPYLREKFIKDTNTRKLHELFNVPRKYPPESGPPARDDESRTHFMDDLRTGEAMCSGTDQKSH